MLTLCALCPFQVFTSTSTIVFKTFACDEEAEEGESYLRADYRLSCDSNMHKWFMVYAGVMILVSELIKRRILYRLNVEAITALDIRSHTPSSFRQESARSSALSSLLW